jgi:DnaJ-class molecular chaperone
MDDINKVPEPKYLPKPKYVPVKCVVCNGFGSLKYGTIKCHGCGGKGYILVEAKEDQNG